MRIFYQSLALITFFTILTTSFAAPVTEWTFHKTADGAHPSGREQAVVWLMNRAREQPAWEGRWLAVCDNSNVASARSYFVVDTDLMISEFAGYPVRPPAAFDRRLYDASSNHCADLIFRDAQDHSNQFVRVDNAGFHYNYISGSVFSYSQDPVHTHAGFNIDWGGGPPDGMQDGRGHRMGIMSAAYDYLSNIGVAMVDPDPTNTIGPIVTTINYAKAVTSYTNHYNRFLVGTVWNDSNSNGFYDAGEGKADVTVTPDVGDFYAITADSGGWALPATVSGTYVVTFSGASIGSDVVVTAEVGAVSVRVPWPGEEVSTQGTPLYWHQSYGTFSNYDSADALDTDSDGMLNWQEYVAGSVPTNSSSFFEITQTAQTNNQLVLAWPSHSDRTYTVLYKTLLDGGAWSNAPAGTGISGTGDTLSYTNTSVAPPCFFRLQIVTP